MGSAPQFRLDGRTVVVIGAGSGIGAAIACACAAQGGTVHCLDLDTQAAGETANTITAAGFQGIAESIDIRDAVSVEEAFCSVRARSKSVDVVVSTPGVNVRKTLLSYSGEEFDRVVLLNLKGTFHVLQTAGRIMSTEHRGSIVVLSSIRSTVVEPGQGVYAATKAGIEMLVKTLACELGPHGVRVNAIAPAIVDTPLVTPIKRHPEWSAAYKAKSVLGRWATVEEVASAAVFLASEAASYITGTVLFVDGGWTAADGRFNPPVG